jgi:hypothetical protein
MLCKASQKLLRDNSFSAVCMNPCKALEGLLRLQGPQKKFPPYTCAEFLAADGKRPLRQLIKAMPCWQNAWSKLFPCLGCNAL